MTQSFPPLLGPNEVILADGDVASISIGRKIFGWTLFVLVCLAGALLFHAVLLLRGFTPLQAGIVVAVFFSLPLLVLLPMSMLIKDTRRWIVTNRRVHFDNAPLVDRTDVLKLRHGRTLVLKSGHEIHLRGATDRTALRAAFRDIKS